MAVTMPAMLRVGIRVIKSDDSSSGSSPGPGWVLREAPKCGAKLERRKDRHAAVSMQAFC